MLKKNKQLTLDIVDEMPIEDKGVVIPKEIISPYESNHSMFSEEYRLERFRYLQFVNAIKSYHDCSFLEARELFFKHRDSGEPIELDFEYFI